MTLICETQATSQKTDAQLEFCFFKDGRALGQGWSSSPKLLLPTVWREDSGSYWCEEKTTALRATRSPRIQIQVQGERRDLCRGLTRGQPRGRPSLGGKELLETCLSFSPSQSPEGICPHSC